jgi:hypothetical protein
MPGQGSGPGALGRGGFADPEPAVLAVHAGAAADSAPLACAYSVPYDITLGNMAIRWPALAGHQVQIGGLSVSAADAARALAVLALSRTSAIAPVLRAIASPLAGCDYFAEAAPYLAAARALPKTGRAGAAGRHVTKHAFTASIQAKLRQAWADELDVFYAALATDERYAAAIAREAAVLRQRAHAAGLRSSLHAAVLRAVSVCATHRGEFRCAEEGACGTGSCRFAQPPYQGLTATAGTGRITRPYNHAEAGRGFSDVSAVAELARLVPWRTGVPVADCAPGAATAA